MIDFTVMPLIAQAHVRAGYQQLAAPSPAYLPRAAAWWW